MLSFEGRGGFADVHGPESCQGRQGFPCKQAAAAKLPCATTRVELMDPSKTTAEDLIIGQFGTMVVVISGFTKIDKDGNGNGFQNPFWSIPRSTEPGDANMEVDLGVKCF